jgi:TolA-binding protein
MDKFKDLSQFFRVSRCLVLSLLVILVSACASSATEDRIRSEEAAFETQQRAEQLAVQTQAAQERARIAQRQLQNRELQIEQERQAQANRVQEQADEQARVERERVAAIAREREQAQRREAAQLGRISALEAEIATARASTQRLSVANARLEQAAQAAQELLEALTSEQSKYTNTNAAGELVEPLDKDGLVGLESRKDTLRSEARSLSQP